MEDLSHYNPEGSTLRRMQQRMLEMLVEVDRILTNNHIEHWIEYGTLIGAVRHGGFIPWDDDIDIGVMRKDYKKAREALIRELPERFAFQDTGTDPYAFFPYGRVRDRRSYCYHPDFVKLKEQGIWLDIFTYDYIPSKGMKKAMDAIYRRAYHEVHHLSDTKGLSPTRCRFNRTVGMLLYPIGWLGKELTIMLGIISGRRMMGVFGTRVINFHENHFPLTKVEFEGYTFPAPGNFDAHLSEVYGNYMQLPRPESRQPILDLSKVKFYE